MGAGGSKKKQPKKKLLKKAVDQNWQIVDQRSQYFNIVRNKMDNRQGEEYSFALDSRHDTAGEALIYNQRNKTNLPLVHTYDHQFEPMDKKEKQKGSNFKYRVVTQRIPYRLSQCPQLAFDESLYTLDQSLQGYEYLYQNVRSFDINSNMIGYNQEGQARVWHNENFGRNYPHHEKNTLQSTLVDRTHRYDFFPVPLEEVEMVRNIVNVIEDRNELGQFPEPFRSLIRQKVGFEEARRIVRDELNKPDRIRLNRVDLWRNMIKSRVISRVHNNNTVNTNIGNYNTSTSHQISNFPVTSTNHYVSRNSQNVQNQRLTAGGLNTLTTHQTNYETNNNYPAKNDAYSLSQNRTYDTVNRTSIVRN